MNKRKKASSTNVYIVEGERVLVPGWAMTSLDEVYVTTAPLTHQSGKKEGELAAGLFFMPPAFVRNSPFPVKHWWNAVNKIWAKGQAFKPGMGLDSEKPTPNYGAIVRTWKNITAKLVDADGDFEMPTASKEETFTSQIQDMEKRAAKVLGYAKTHGDAKAAKMAAKILGQKGAKTREQKDFERKYGSKVVGESRGRRRFSEGEEFPVEDDPSDFANVVFAMGMADFALDLGVSILADVAHFRATDRNRLDVFDVQAEKKLRELRALARKVGDRQDVYDGSKYAAKQVKNATPPKIDASTSDEMIAAALGLASSLFDFAADCILNEPTVAHPAGSDPQVASVLALGKDLLFFSKKFYAAIPYTFPKQAFMAAYKRGPKHRSGYSESSPSPERAALIRENRSLAREVHASTAGMVLESAMADLSPAEQLALIKRLPPFSTFSSPREFSEAVEAAQGQLGTKRAAQQRSQISESRASVRDTKRHPDPFGLLGSVKMF